jgi:hypothetical protein
MPLFLTAENRTNYAAKVHFVPGAQKEKRFA